MSEEPLTPIDVERRLNRTINDLTLAQRALRDARDAEVAAKHDYEDVRRRAMFRPDCPKVSRGGVTTAEREAWIELEAASFQRVYDVAEVRRKAAEDHLRTLNSQGVLLATLAKSVHLAYSQAGAS